VSSKSVAFVRPRLMAAAWVVVVITGSHAKSADSSPGMLGVIPVDDDGQVFVKEVYVGGPAQLGGLRPGDRIIEIEGKSVNSAVDLIAAVGSYEANRPVEIRASREGWAKQISVALRKREDVLRMRHTSVFPEPLPQVPAQTNNSRQRGWIDEERLKHINDPYYRAKKTRW
jgi:S1-C subfamily serine protease